MNFDPSTVTSAPQPISVPEGKPQPDSEDIRDEDEDEAPEFEFRLFSTGNDTKTEPQKIVLELEEEELGGRRLSGAESRS